MNKKLLYTVGILVLVVLGYFALQDEAPQIETAQPFQMEPVADKGLELYKEFVTVPFNKPFSIDEEWSLVITQFEPDAKISDPGVITSDSDQEQNPAVKVDLVTLENAAYAEGAANKVIIIKTKNFLRPIIPPLQLLLKY